jgi:hypothetical protein
MREKEEKLRCFGPGYRSFTSVREVQVCPICASPDPDICLEELPTEQFRFEKCGNPEDPDYSVRIRSDVSMLLHAADLAKKYGQNFVQSMIDLRRPKSSSIQELMDEMSDDQILDTVKSRHLQSPSERIAWSEYLMDQARSAEQEAERLALEKEVTDTSASVDSQSTESQSE